MRWQRSARIQNFVKNESPCAGCQQSVWPHAVPLPARSAHSLVSVSTVIDIKSVTTKHDKCGACREWDRIARETNRAQDVVRELRQFGVEMATIAWAKMYEACVRFALFPATPKESTARAIGTNSETHASTCATVHLCEAPGAFVAACNHYVRTERERLEWDWRAITLNPYWEGNDEAAMVTDDALIAQTESRWSWGEDTSGAARATRPHIEQSSMALSNTQ